MSKQPIPEKVEMIGTFYALFLTLMEMKTTDAEKMKALKILHIRLKIFSEKHGIEVEKKEFFHD